MTDATITANVHQSFDVHLDFGTQITFHFITCTNYFTNLSSLVISPVLNFNAAIYSCCIKNLSSTTAPYTINISQRNLTSFILR